MPTTLWTHWAWPILSGKTHRVALPVALVVGTILLAVNQGSLLLTGEIGPATLVRAALANYTIPYVVSSIGYLKAPNRSQHPQREEVTPR